jgi:hypothetical protein
MHGPSTAENPRSLTRSRLHVRSTRCARRTDLFGAEPMQSKENCLIRRSLSEGQGECATSTKWGLAAGARSGPPTGGLIFMGTLGQATLRVHAGNLAANLKTDESCCRGRGRFVQGIER